MRTSVQALLSPRRVVATVVVTTSLATAQIAAPTPDSLATIDARTAVSLANERRGDGVTTFVTPQAVHFVFPDGPDVEVAMPADTMLVSVAPYLTRTHPCATHYPSGCQGELVAQDVHVRALLPDGTVVIDEARTTLPNGFLDLWLPRGREIDLRLSVDGYVAEGRVTTFADSPTCITDLRLARAGTAP